MAKAQQPQTQAIAPTAPAEEQGMQVYDETDTSGWIKPLDAAAYEGVVVERVHSMTEKTVLEGVLLGRGQTLESTDERTGEVRAIHTHRIKVHSQLTVAVLETYALRALRALPIGQRVRLIHRGFIRKGTKQIADVIPATLGAAPDGAAPDSRWNAPPVLMLPAPAPSHQ